MCFLRNIYNRGLIWWPICDHHSVEKELSLDTSIAYDSGHAQQQDLLTILSAPMSDHNHKHIRRIAESNIGGQRVFLIWFNLIRLKVNATARIQILQIPTWRRSN